MSSWILLSVLLFSIVVCNAQNKEWNVPDECPFANDVHSLPVTLRGMWRENRGRLLSLAKPSLAANSIIFLSGDKEQSRYPFRQNSNFFYLSGADMPGYFLSINSSSSLSTLFVPTPSADYAVWNGHLYTKQQLIDMYDVDDVLYTNETTLFVRRLPPSTTVYTIDSSVPLPTPILQLSVNRNTLPPIMTQSRATKSAKEITLLTLVNKISSFSHIIAMQFVASRLNTSLPSSLPLPLSFSFSLFNKQMPSLGALGTSGDERNLHLPLDDVARQALAELTSIQSDHKFVPPPPTKTDAIPTFFEYEVGALFEFQTGLCGALQQAYLPIVGSGNNGAVLHYVANSAPIFDGELLLIDAGGEYWGYGSDVTSTYPVNGVFTDAQRLIYNIVLQTQTDVVQHVKNGVTWTTLNTVARESITRYMLDAGLLQGSFSALMSNSIYSIFYPHSIGHSLGLDVHDSQTSTIYTNQVITVEPGVYFNTYLLDQARASSTKAQYIVWSKVDQFRGTGGVRIEDDFVVTPTGSIRITSVPRSIEEIEKIMQSV